ncbi:MAG: glucose-6-phosphate isomerase, partial [Spirochaetaceae bacterium]|nr:glucose-6-phosphate isomerase [Spirochaetaceae bacterium]
MNYLDFDKTAGYRKLAALASKPKVFDVGSLLTAERVKNNITPMAAGLTYSWAAKGVDDSAVEALQALSDELELIEKYTAILNGETMNPGENRKVLHHLLRGQLGKPVIHAGKDLGVFYRQELDRFSAFAEKVHTGKIRGSTGKAFAAAVQIGIGGSDLGPRALYLALENWASGEGKSKLRASFISNVDPDDAAQVVRSVPLEETIFILVSKSG